jgi:hypothetical protein
MCWQNYYNSILRIKKHRYPCWIVIIKALDGLVGDGLCTPLREHDIYRNVGAVT